VHAPEVEKKYIQTEDIRAIIFNAVDGLNLYNQLQSGKDCLFSVNLYVTDLELMLDALIEAFYVSP
jgi:hypothetical protein